MMTKITPFGSEFSLAPLVRKFLGARSGNVAMITVLTITPMMMAAGAAIDYSFAAKAKGKLEEAAQVAATTAAATTRRVVNSYTTSTSPPVGANDSTAITEGQRVGVASFNAQVSVLRNLTGTNATVTIARNGNTINAKVNYQSQLQTTVMRLYGVGSINLAGEGKVILGMMDEPANNPNGATYSSNAVIDETWTIGPGDMINSSGPSTPILNNWYSGTAGNGNPLQSGGFAVTGYASRNAMRIGSPNNSMPRLISKKVYLKTGGYQLRYWYKSATNYADYDPVHICATAESEVNWAISGRTIPFDSLGSIGADDITYAQGSRAGVYLVPITTNPQLATTTPDISNFPRPSALSSTLANNYARTDTSSYRVDICVFSPRWIQRTVSIDVTSAGYFWLSFVSDVPTSTSQAGTSGFFLGPVQICPGTCSDAAYNNSPWTAYDAATGTAGTTLFTDSFDTPKQGNHSSFNLASGTIPSDAKYRNPIGNWIVTRYSTGGTLNNSAGQTNDYVYGTAGPGRANPADGTQYLKGVTTDRSLVRRLMLMPGFYRVRVSAGNLPVMYNCNLSDPGEYHINFSRQDWQQVYGQAAVSPPNWPDVNGGSALEGAGCGLMTNLTYCYFVTTAQFYDLGLSVYNLGGAYIDPNKNPQVKTITFDRVSIEFLANYTDARDGFPNPAGACNSNTMKPDGTTQVTTNQWTVTGGTGDYWPGVRTKTFDRYKITTPLP